MQAMHPFLAHSNHSTPISNSISNQTSFWAQISIFGPITPIEPHFQYFEASNPQSIFIFKPGLNKYGLTPKTTFLTFSAFQPENRLKAHEAHFNLKINISRLLKIQTQNPSIPFNSDQKSEQNTQKCS